MPEVTSQDAAKALAIILLWGMFCRFLGILVGNWVVRRYLTPENNQ